MNGIYYFLYTSQYKIMFIVELFKYRKLRKLIDKIDREEQIFDNFSKLFQSNFKTDWIGRRYTVLNPRVQGIDKDDTSGISSQIFEFTEQGMRDSIFIEKWCMDRIRAASLYIVNKQLLDVLTYSIERIDDNENYLFILKPILFDDLKDSFRKFIKRTLWAIGILALILIGITIF